MISGRSPFSPRIQLLIDELHRRIVRDCRDLLIPDDELPRPDGEPFKATAHCWPVRVRNDSSAYLLGHIRAAPMEVRDLWIVIGSSSHQHGPEKIHVQHGLPTIPINGPFRYKQAIEETPEADREESTFDTEAETAAVDYIMAVVKTHLEPLPYFHEQFFLDGSVGSVIPWDLYDSEGVARRRKAFGHPSNLEIALRSRARREVVPLSSLQGHEGAPRERSDRDTINPLVMSIQTENLREPILVRQLAFGYEIVAGHRRFRAWQILSRIGRMPGRIPVFIIDGMEDGEARRIVAAETGSRTVTPISDNHTGW